ncbi:MAG: hypothetical protein AAF362_00185 [Pseudomonadota bacterium]
MKLFIALAVMISGAAYLGFVPEFDLAGIVPLSLLAGGTITVGMLYFLARVEQ